MNKLYKSMNRRVSPLAALGTALTSFPSPLPTALRQVRGARWRGLSMAVLLLGLMGGLGVVNPTFASHQGDGVCETNDACLD